MDAKEFNDKIMNGHFRKIYPVIARQIVDRTGISEGCCVDLGGGPGLLGISLAKITRLQVTVYDLMPECVALALQNSVEHGVDDQVTAQQGIAECMPFDENSLDLVVSRGSIFFWENQMQGLAEVYRVLKPGGWAYLGGGFGTSELLREIELLMADEADWNRKRQERMVKNPPEQFESMLRQLGIEGRVEQDDAGMWVVFCKQKSAKA